MSPERRRRRRLAISRLVALAAAAVAGFAYGVLCHWLELPPYAQLRRLHTAASAVTEEERPRGNWHAADDRGPDDGHRVSIAALGYLSAYEPRRSDGGVLAHDPARAQPGYNLYTSGHAPSAFLMGMDGGVVHEWSHAFERAFPGDARAAKNSSSNWRRARLLDDGALLAIFDYVGLIQVDRDSELMWANPMRFHHDLDLFDGKIYGIAEEYRRLPRIAEHEVREDFVVVLDDAGEIVRRVSILEAFESSRYAPLLANAPPGSADILHTNTIEVLDGALAGRSPAFARGNVLISVLALDTVAIVDLDRGRIVWALSGLWRRQHQPTILGDGALLVFDNLGNAGLTRVLELDPFTQEVHWAYDGTEENGFYSGTLGAAHRLDNGNTLIVESEAGRAFEVTPTLELVWEFVNPARGGDDGELVAALYDVIRVPGDQVAGWLELEGR